MTLKQFISFIGGLILTAIIYALIMYVFMFATFSFAGETLSEKENRESFFFYTSIFIIVLTLYVVYRRLKTNRKFSVVGIAIPLLFAFYILFVTGQVYFGNLNYRQKFDQAKWKQSESKPFKMAKTMTKDNVLIGQTKQQVLDKLGITKDTLKNDKVDYLKYWTDNGTWELRLYFKNDKVVDAYLYEEGLGI
jgi:energy-coupling factor transporter transmembrane protein EcfT